jgi:hypothetical protein
MNISISNTLLEMEERLSALFEDRVGKVEQEMRAELEKQRVENDKQREEIEKQRVEIEKQRVENDSFRSLVSRLESDNTQLKLDNTRIVSDLSEVQNDLRILHPLPYAHLHLEKCIEHQIACNNAVNAFVELHTPSVIHSSSFLTNQLQELKKDLKKAWDARFAAAFLCEPPPTLESLLWIVAKSGFTKEVAPFMNLSKVTRGCKNLQRVMREVRNKKGMTQLYFYCLYGMTSSVMRMLEMKSIDVEAKLSDELQWTCLMEAAYFGHFDICRLLVNKGAQMEAKDVSGDTPLHWAAGSGHLEIVRLLCDRGADIEARCNGGWRPLHIAALSGRISIVKELVEVRNAEIDARTDGGRTALWYARQACKDDIAAFLVSRGGVDDVPDEEFDDLEDDN